MWVVRCQLVFFPDEAGTSISVFKGLWVQTTNAFPHFAHCTDAVNKARRLIAIIRRSFQDLSKSVIIPLHGVLVRSRLSAKPRTHMMAKVGISINTVDMAGVRLI